MNTKNLILVLTVALSAFGCATKENLSEGNREATMPAAESADVTRPNIVILYADDLGYGDLGSYNSESKIPTPHLDRLAAEGMRLTDAHSSSAICTPSRYAMLTGRYHWRDFHGIVGAFGGTVFKPGQLTLPKMLQAEGYTTAAIGKWHLGWDWDAIRRSDAPADGVRPEHFDWSKPIPEGPLEQGFDHYFGDTVINFPPYAWIEDDRVLQAPDTMMDIDRWKPVKEGFWECRPGPMVTGWDPYENIPETTRRGVDYIHAQKESESPFFLYFAYPAPHAPIIPNDQFDGKSEAGSYGDYVYEIDDSAGQLLRALEDSGQADNTIVIFSADNGPEWYAYARDEKYDHWSSDPLRGLKRDVYEGGHRVPTIIKWPGVVDAGSVNNALVSQIDFMATLAAVTGYDLPDDAAVDSYNQLPVLTGEAEAVRTTHVHTASIGEHNYAIRDGDWLLINANTGLSTSWFRKRQTKTLIPEWNARHGYDSTAWDQFTSGEEVDGESVLLYNLASDLPQMHNLADDHSDRVTELQAKLQTIREQSRSAPNQR